MSSVTSDQPLVSDLLRLGVATGDLLLVHSSLRSLGHVPGGAETVIRALLQAVGDTGTLLMPALSYEFVTARQPLFDARRTASCVGTIPETFRKLPGTLRSVHPTHSVCGAGARAAELLSRHHLDHTPVGPNSPFSLLPKVGGKILMLGCGLRPNTSMHGVEELVEPPYLFSDTNIEYVICDEKGQQVTQQRRHGFAGWAQRYDRLEQVMTDGIATGTIGEAKAFLIDARRMWEVAHGALLRDPLCFVERLAG